MSHVLEVSLYIPSILEIVPRINIGPKKKFKITL